MPRLSSPVLRTTAADVGEFTVERADDIGNADLAADRANR